MSEQRLREYIENDKAYQDYKMKKPVSEYIRLHISLCRDIENVLNELQQLKEQCKKHCEQYQTVCDELTSEKMDLEQENQQLKEELEFVLEQILGAFTQNWCIDWNFTDIREKYSISDKYEWNSGKNE